MTSDCPVGATRKRRRKTVAAVVGASALASATLSSMLQPTLGEVRPRPRPHDSKLTTGVMEVVGDDADPLLLREAKRTPPTLDEMDPPEPKSTVLR